MEGFPSAVLARQRRMKRISRVLFGLAVMMVLLPVVVGLFGFTVGLPVALVVPFLVVAGIIAQVRSDQIGSSSP